MFKKPALFLSLFFTSIAPINFASAASIANGGFDTDLSGWSTLDSTNDPLFTANGVVSWSAGQAVLETGGGVAALSAALIQGDDGNFNFPSPLLLASGNELLKFDAQFSSLGADASEGSSSSTDNLQVWMYDANDPTGNHLLATINLLTGATGFSVDLTSFVGLSVAFSFELNDEDDGLNSRVLLDNIRLESRAVTVPEPNALWLMLIGSIGLICKVLRVRQKVQ